jgi:hypothetical protein
MSEKVNKLIDFAAHGTPEAPVGSQEWIWGVTNSAEHCLAEVQPHQRLAALCRLSPAPNQSAKDVSMIGFFIVCGVLFAIIAACWNA